MERKNKYFIAIAGNTGSGKTTVCHILEGLGYKVVYTDKQVRNFLNQPFIVDKLKEYAGDEVASNGKLNFSYIGAYFDTHYKDECEFEIWFQPYFGKFIINQLNSMDESIIFVDTPLLYYKKIQDYFYSIWWICSNFSADNVKKRNGYHAEKIDNLIKFSSKKTEAANYHTIQNNDTKEALKIRIKDEIEKLMKEIQFSD